MDNVISHLVDGEPLDRSVGDILAESSRPGLAIALLALSAPDEALQSWASTTAFSVSNRLEKIALVSAQSDEVDASVEDELDSDASPAAADALARAGVAWTHPGLISALDREQTRTAAALLLSTADPDAIRSWLDACGVFEDARSVLRAAGMSGVHALEDSVRAWRDELEDFEQARDELAQLDGIMAVLDADTHARDVLAGDADAGWLSLSATVADFLQVYGPGEWLSVLSMLDICDDPAFEFGAFLSVCAASGIGFEEPDEDEARRLVDMLSFEPDADPEDWEPVATSVGLRFAIALAADDDLALLGAQVGAHERLVAFGFHSPGVPGLPMSGTDVEALDFNASNAMLKQLLDGPSMPEAAKVAVLRTLDDLYNHVVFGDGECDEHARTWASRFEDSDVASIALATRRLKVALDQGAIREEEAKLAERPTLDTAMVLAAAGEATDDVVTALGKAARSEKVLGLAATQRLAMSGSLDALDLLATLWAEGPVCRAPLYRDALATGAQLLHESDGAH